MRVENTSLARELFVNEVGDTVRHQTQIALGHDKALPTQILTPNHVPEPEAHVISPIGSSG